MWITRVVIHNQSPGNNQNYAKIPSNTANKGENQRGGQSNSLPIVDNSIVHNYESEQNAVYINKTAHIVDNSPILPKTSNAHVEKDIDYPQEYSAIEEIKRELTGLKSDLSTLEKRDKQRGNSTFSQNSGQGGQAGLDELWKSEKLSTMGVDNFYNKAGGNPFKVAIALKKEIARGLSVDGETMLFTMISRLDFSCDGDTCIINVMENLAPILHSNVGKIQQYVSGFKIKVNEIKAFAQNAQAEVDKIKKYFGEEYLKMVDSL